MQLHFASPLPFGAPQYPPGSIVSILPAPLESQHHKRPQWLELLRPFIAVKDQHLSEEAVLRIAPAMQELLGVRTNGFGYPRCNIYAASTSNPGAVQGSIEQFVAARQDAGRPVAAVSRLDRGKEGINACTGGSKVDKSSAALPVPLTLDVVYLPLVILLDTRRSTNEVPRALAIHLSASP